MKSRIEEIAQEERGNPHHCSEVAVKVATRVLKEFVADITASGNLMFDEDLDEIKKKWGIEP